MTATGIDFLALQVTDLERSARFYETCLGLRRAATGPPDAVVFDSTPIPFAVRRPLTGVDIAAAAPRPGAGVALWFLAEDAQALHESLAADGVEILAAPADGPFGRMFTFADPDGYAVTIHDRA